MILVKVIPDTGSILRIDLSYKDLLEKENRIVDALFQKQIYHLLLIYSDFIAVHFSAFHALRILLPCLRVVTDAVFWIW